MLDYSQDYYERLRLGSRASAQEIIPLVLDWASPRSVVDVGCGTGAWLAEFQEQGVDEVLGIDGQSFDEDRLEISKEEFLQVDLTENVTIDREFDLVVCLEVAEHLPEGSAESLITLLTDLGPVVLFSAAVPFQGGQHHINEQWPEYWNRLFRQEEYVVVDGIRKRIWNNDAVEWWYAQNTLIFVRNDQLDAYPELVRERRNTFEGQLALIHPENYRRAHWSTRIAQLQQRLEQFASDGDQFVLVDDGEFGSGFTLSRPVTRFFARDGEYVGPPADSSAAIEELRRLQHEGATVLVFAWPAFWWTEYYSEFFSCLEANFRRAIDGDDYKVYELNA